LGGEIGHLKRVKIAIWMHFWVRSGMPAVAADAFGEVTGIPTAAKLGNAQAPRAARSLPLEPRRLHGQPAAMFKGRCSAFSILY
jgi:hypothetical protein